MSRAHVQGYDSNPAQFERMGNPWLTERERVGEACMTPKRLKRIGKFPKPEVPTPDRKPARSARSESEAMEQSLRSRRFIAAFKSGLPEGTRTVAAAVEPTIIWQILPATEMRLTAEMRAKRGWQKLEFAAKRLAAEQAYVASEAGRLAERRRLAALIQVMESQLENLG